MDFLNNFVCESKEYSTYTEHVAAPLFRKTVNIKGKAKEAEMLICGLGFYELFINGKKVTKGHLAPYISNLDHILYYDSYDITSFLQEGENVIGVMLGDGFLNAKSPVWNFHNNVFNSSPKMALNATIKDEKGVISFDARQFRCKKGPFLFNDLRSGVFYDRRLEPTGWNAPGFCEDDTWHQPLLAETPKGKARICEAEPIVITKELRPVNIYRGELDEYVARQDVQAFMEGKKIPELPPSRSGGWIYDFGENNAGIFRLKIKGKKGQRVDIQCAEQEKGGKLSYQNWNFYPDGYVQRDVYILGSDEEEIFEPMFTYHGYRYLYVSGITEEQATEELLTYLVMSSDLEERGSFQCSDEMANRIYESGRRSDWSNFYYFPTDCPQREKNGWTGDAAASAEHMILTMGVEKSWREWLANIRGAQLESGMLPVMVPTGNWGYTSSGSNPAWDRVLFTLPYVIYRYRGETEAIYENEKAMMTYLRYVSGRRNKDGLLEKGLGDWAQVDKPATQPDASPVFTNSVMVYHMCRMATEMFEAVDNKENRDFAAKLGEELRKAIRQEFVELKTMKIKQFCQTSQAMAIYYDIFEEQDKTEAFEQLLSLIHQEDDKVNCGFLGMNVIFHVLAQYGQSELAYQMITGKEYPSYGWYIDNGYTTLPEQFYRDIKVSDNHHFLGDVVQWFMRYPAGLHVESHKKITVKPLFIEKLNFAQASHKLPAGEVKVSWERSGEHIVLEVHCPDSVQCEIALETGCQVVEQQGTVWTIKY